MLNLHFLNNGSTIVGHCDFLIRGDKKFIKTLRTKRGPQRVGNRFGSKNVPLNGNESTLIASTPLILTLES